LRCKRWALSYKKSPGMFTRVCDRATSCGGARIAPLNQLNSSEKATPSDSGAACDTHREGARQLTLHVQGLGTSTVGQSCELQRASRSVFGRTERGSFRLARFPDASQIGISRHRKRRKSAILAYFRGFDSLSMEQRRDCGHTSASS